MEQNISSFVDLLKSAQTFELMELWSRGPPVTIYSQQSLEYALYLINKFRVFSLPVLNSSDAMIGLVDVLDIVKELVSWCDGGYNEDKVKAFLASPVDTLFLHQLDKDRSKSYCISRHCSALVAIQEMLFLNRSRFLIVDRELAGNVEELPGPENFFQGIISTTDVLRFLCKFPTWLKREKFFNQKIRDLFGSDFKKPRIVNQKEITGKVFSEMASKGFKGFAVVDDGGKLVFNISPSDLKGITANNWHLLNKPLSEFLREDRTRDWWWEPICVDLDASLYETMQQFVCTKVHRMYIVDKAGIPTGELNHKQVLRQVLEFVASTQELA
jgi:CBS domain-containing protein